MLVPFGCDFWGGEVNLAGCILYSKLLSFGHDFGGSSFGEVKCSI